MKTIKTLIVIALILVSNIIIANNSVKTENLESLIADNYETSLKIESWMLSDSIWYFKNEKRKPFRSEFRGKRTHDEFKSEFRGKRNHDEKLKNKFHKKHMKHKHISNKDVKHKHIKHKHMKNYKK